MMCPLVLPQQVELAFEQDLSQSRACGLVGVSRPTMLYELRMPIKDASGIDAMKTFSAQYLRYGYRRTRIFLQRQGMKLSWSRTHRIRRCAGLPVAQEAPQASHRGQPAQAVHALQGQHSVGL